MGLGDRKQSPSFSLLIAVIFLLISSRDKSILGFMQTHIRVLQHNLRKSAAQAVPVLSVWKR